MSVNLCVLVDLVMFETMWYLCGLLCNAVRVVSCCHLLSTCIWWWSFIALIVIITPFVSTTFGWFWYDLYPFLYPALCYLCNWYGEPPCLCASLVLRVFLYHAHIQGELVPSIAQIG